MTLVEAASIASLVVSCISILSVFYLASVKIAKMEVKVDTLWDFMMRRARVEAVTKGFATLNSPIVVAPEAIKWADHILPPIKEFYLNELASKNPTENELAMEIERRFGNKIMEEMCIPRGLQMGSCLLIVIQAVTEAVRKPTTLN